MNIAVINLKDIIKYAVSFVLVLAILIGCTNAFKKEEFKESIEKAENRALSSVTNSSFLNCLKIGLPLIANYDERKQRNIVSTSEMILSSQLALIKNVQDEHEYEDLEEDIVENLEISDINNNTKVNENEGYQDVPDTADTEVISEHNINAKYTDTANNVQINNQTSFNLDEIISNSSYELSNKNKVIIYHTHTCESYTPSDAFSYEMTGAYRTTDLNFTVSRVGDELENLLTSYGKTVVHDKTYHDYPAYNGSYGRSLKTMTGVLENNQDAEIMIDLHRDAVRK